MNQNQSNTALTALRAMEGKQLGAVTFVQDYVQLAFDGPGLTAYSFPSIWVDDQLWERATTFYRDRLCGQISKIVAEVSLTNEKIIVRFIDDSRIEISLKVPSGCAEAAIFSDPETGYFGVWN